MKITVVPLVLTLLLIVSAFTAATGCSGEGENVSNTFGDRVHVRTAKYYTVLVYTIDKRFVEYYSKRGLAHYEYLIV